MPAKSPAARMVDMRVPLTWLISSAAAAIIALGTVLIQIRDATSGIAELKLAVHEIKTAQEKREDKLTIFGQSLTETRAQLTGVQSEVGLLRTEISDMRRDQRITQMEHDDRNQPRRDRK
jgi:septal ring factor EnvC (AmiA/AmiB activator)